MAIARLQLTRSLRKQILQGHPWVYTQNFKVIKSQNQVSLAELKDPRGQFLCWGYYDPNSVLGFRVLSFNKKQPPNNEFYKSLVANAIDSRRPYLSEQNNSLRLINGEGDRMPGLVCDLYNDVATLQCDGLGPTQFWDLESVAQYLLELLPQVKTVYHKPRKTLNLESTEWGKPMGSAPYVVIKENGCAFAVDIVNGQKTGFFLDQRENRDYIKKIAHGKSVLNLFSYTGGFSVYAGMGGATQVTSVDIAPKAIELANLSWGQNNLPASKHEGVVDDVFEYIGKEPRLFDLVIIDPPSLTHAEKDKATAFNKYVEVFAEGLQRVKPGGELALSSCSSHISFDDFFSITEQTLSKGRRNGQILRVSGQGPDHPFPHVCPELRYLKFVHLKLDGLA